jgi:hypothetical protein
MNPGQTKGVPRFFGMVTFVLHKYSVNHDSQILEPAWLPHNKQFCGPESHQTSTNIFDVLGEPLGYPVGTFGKHSQRPFHHYLRCLFWVTAHTLALYSFIYKILFSFILFLFI